MAARTKYDNYSGFPSEKNENLKVLSLCTEGLSTHLCREETTYHNTSYICYCYWSFSL